MYTSGYKYVDSKDGKVYRVVKHCAGCYVVEQVYPAFAWGMPIGLTKIVSERYIDNMALKNRPKFVYRWAAGHQDNSCSQWLDE